MERVGEHPVNAGPLAVRWLAYELGPARAGVTGTARIALENAGSATWRSRGANRRAARVSLARPAGQPDRLGWNPRRAAAAGRARRDDRARRSARGPRPPGRLSPLLRPRRGVPVLVRRGRLGDARRPGRGRAPDRRAAAHGRRRRGAGRGDDRGARGAGRSRSSSATKPRLPTRAGRAARTRLVAAAPRRPRRRVARGRRRGGGGLPPRQSRRSRRGRPAGRNPRFDRPLLFPSLLDGAGARRAARACRPTTARSGLFEGRAVVRFRPRSGRPRA